MSQPTEQLEFHAQAGLSHPNQPGGKSSSNTGRAGPAEDVSRRVADGRVSSLLVHLETK